MAPRRLTLSVNPSQAGKRVETLLRKELGLSGSAVRRAKALPGGITLDGIPAFTNVVVSAGQLLSVQIGDGASDSKIAPLPGPLVIFYEDEDLIILNKAAPLPVHPGPGPVRATLGAHLMDYYQKNDIIAQFHPVNRLDRGTSGLMAVAKHSYAHERLQSALRSGDFSREYLAVLQGRPPQEQGLIDLPIGRADGSVLRREVRPDGSQARTRYRLLCRGKRHSLVALGLETGRTHQIRVHLAHLGCPVAGDFLYGTEDAAMEDRFALHAFRLRLRHPLSGVHLSFSTPLPPSFSALLGGDPGLDLNATEDFFESIGTASHSAPGMVPGQRPDSPLAQ